MQKTFSDKILTQSWILDETQGFLVNIAFCILKGYRQAPEEGGMTATARKHSGALRHDPAYKINKQS